MHRIPVRQIMTPTVVTIHPEELVADAAQLMDEFDLRRLPVVDEDDTPHGMVALDDLVRHLGREADAVADTVILQAANMHTDP